MISFIIPAYNAEKTIKRAINSILNQEKSNLDFEIIVVNDGSSDNLDEAIKEFKENPKIKYFKKDNTGVSDTRNYGVDKATGEYIIFVDSDDYVSNTLLKDIQEHVQNEIDLIKWTPIFVDEEENEISKEPIISFNKTTGEQGFNKLFGKDNLIDCLWNYAIKKDIMIEFPSGSYHEDFAVMPLIILKAKTMVGINHYEYYYVQTKNSIMRDSNEEKTRKKLQDKLTHFDNLLLKTNKMNISKLAKENIGIFATNSMIIALSELKGETRKWFLKELKQRKISKNIKVRNIKQLIKRIILDVKY